MAEFQYFNRRTDIDSYVPVVIKLIWPYRSFVKQLHDNEWAEKTEKMKRAAAADPEEEEEFEDDFGISIRCTGPVAISN